MSDQSDLLDRARAWAAEDPDPQTRAELEALVEAAEAGDETALADLADRFAGTLEFGTAGLRGALGAGPNRMNRVVVIRAAAGLAAYLRDHGATDGDSVVIGYDARHNSDVFARDTAEVMTGAGLSGAGAAPPAAHAAAGVRDPRPRLRGRGDGDRQPQPAAGQRLQGLPRRRQPDRAAGGRRRSRRGSRRSAPLADVPRGERLARCSATRSSTATSTRSPRLVGDGPRDLTIVYTPLHGVGGATRRRRRSSGPASRRRTWPSRRPSPTRTSRRSPSPTPRSRARWTWRWRSPRRSAPTSWSPTTRTPTGARSRCPGPHGWRMLRGDEVGALLGRPPAPAAARDGRLRHLDRVVVAARQDGRGGRAAVRRDADRLQVDRPRRGPRVRLRGGARLLRRPRATCRDKDGDLGAAAGLRARGRGSKAEGRTLLDRLDDIAREHGLHATDQLSVRVDDLAAIAGRDGPAARPPADALGGLARRAASTTSSQGVGGRCRRPTGCATGSPSRRPGDRAPVGHRAEDQVLPGGRGPGRGRRPDGVDAARISAAGRLDAIRADVGRRGSLDS